MLTGAAIVAIVAVGLAGFAGSPRAAGSLPVPTPMRADANRAPRGNLEAVTETEMNATHATRTHGDALRAWQSRFDFATTLERLRGTLAAKGITIFAEIDQAAAAAAAGAVMPPTVLIVFGNPLAGTPIMVRHPQTAVELPLKLVVRQDGETVRVEYLDAARVLTRDYGVDEALVAPLARVPDLLAAAVATANGQDDH
ncbi:DUF302 domain-containing protein [Burkholderia perseverans]|uniref:DUF302 domain-containing protein n=1 Tax=Burkholderia perseverans TaxID=2615214 RepID=UPI001FF07061|nr:DUF302 domain-containing protein [Burkholderia perseverans]